MKQGIIRCGKWAVKRERYCATHLYLENDGPDQIVRIGGLPVFYSSRLKGTLKDAVQQALDRPVHEQLSVLEELALVRASAADVVEEYCSAVEANDQRRILQTGLLLRDTMQKVANLAESATRIAMSGNDVSVHTLHVIVNQIVRVAYEAFKDNEDKAREFERLIFTQVKLPSLSGDVQGTSVTPDQDVAAMDAAVPYCPMPDQSDEVSDEEPEDMDTNC